MGGMPHLLKMGVLLNPMIGLEPPVYGTHSIRRTKASIKYITDKESERRSIIAWSYQA
jgi:hypothetical protein